MDYTILDIFNKFGNDYLDKYKTSYNRLNIYNNIKTCRTKEQGIRIYKCTDCGKKIYTYKSCMNRHCPTCLEYKKEIWIEKHKEDILDINYYHIVLSLPKGIHPLFLNFQIKCNKCDNFNIYINVYFMPRKSICNGQSNFIILN